MSYWKTVEISRSATGSSLSNYYYVDDSGKVRGFVSENTSSNFYIPKIYKYLSLESFELGIYDSVESSKLAIRAYIDGKDDEK